MTSLTLSSPAWSSLFRQTPQEFDITPLTVVEGELPQNLKGSLYKIAPARFERGNQRVGHLFDGDGAVLAVHFQESKARGQYRFIQTQGYLTEEKANKLIFGGYGRRPSGSFWQSVTLPLKNCPNTGLLALRDRLLALWDAGSPHSLSLDTLDTLGLDDLGGLDPQASYGTHPKIDPLTGEIYNFGVSYGRKGVLQLYRSNPDGQIQQSKAIALDGLPLIHDFVRVGDYLVFFIPPVRLNPLPFLMKQKCFSDCLVWEPDKGTEILVIDRHSLTVISRGQTEPWFQWRFGHSYIDHDQTVVIDLVRYPDFQINQFLKEVVTGETKTLAKGTLWQVRLNPKTAQIIENRQLIERSCEFPVISPSVQDQAHRYTYLCVHRHEKDLPQELFNGLARFDHQTGELKEAHLETGYYPGAPVYLWDQKNSEKGWILVEVFNTHQDSSELWLFDADPWYSEQLPICKIGLPSLIPLSFTGIWLSNPIPS